MTAPVELEGATFVEHLLQLRPATLHTRLCAGEGNVQPITEFLLRQPIELGYRTGPRSEALALRLEAP